MKIIILGSGSIGMRHLKNCFALLPHAAITIISRNKSKSHFEQEVTVLNTLESAFQDNKTFDFAIVATPTTYHIQNCLDLLIFGVKKIYVEKPISNNFDNFKELIALKNSKFAQIFVGFDMKFDPGLNKVKQLIEQNAIGTLVSFQSEVGQYLPDWRPNENYKEGMSAKIELGGGVLLDLVHEFDFLTWIVGKIDKIYGFNNKIQHLDIESEGIAVNILRTTNGVLGVLSLDYIQRKLSRNAKFIGDKGNIEWDYVTSTVKWFVENKWNYFTYSHFERNDRFKLILKSFIEANHNYHDPRLTLIEESTSSLQLVLEAKKTNNI